MRIIFARHGQTDWNILGKVQGTTDIELNETGIRQAGLLCENLKKENIHPYKIYSSYQKRALKTAQIVGEAFDVPVETIDGLQEMNLGDFEGHTWDEIHTIYAKEVKEWLLDKRYNKTPNGESYQLVLERLFSVLDHIFRVENTEEAKEKDILVVTHGAVILSLFTLQRNLNFLDSFEHIQVKNAEPFMLDVEEIEEIRKKL